MGDDRVRGDTDAPGATRRLRASASRLALEGPRPGASWCSAWTEEVDGLLIELLATCDDATRRSVALVAVGGYGRRELCPSSDIDLLVLHAGLEHDALERLVRAVVYPLWDVGLTVGYAVRTRREALAAIDELDAATALLDARTLAGDAGLAAQVRIEALRRITRRPQRLLAQLLAADDDRHARTSTPTETLEPDLKLGAGGLRDLQSLRWAAAALVGTPGLEPLVPTGFLGAPDLPRLRRAGEGLLAARVALHLARAEREGRSDAPARQRSKDDTVRFELHDDIAARLGHVDGGPSDLAPHRMLRDLALDARTIAHAHQRAWALIRADLARGRRRRSRPSEQQVDGFDLVDGVLRIPEDLDVTAAELPVRLLTGLATTGAVLERRSAGRVRAAALAGAPWRIGPAEGRGLLRVLWSGRPALPAIADLDDAGVLTVLLPEWEPTRGRTQRNPYHRFTLDRHGWNAAAELAELVRREAWAAETLERVADRDALMLAAVLHDVGKVHGEPHAETGVAPARRLAERLGAGPETVEEVGRLVRLHLLLPDTARRRDLADPALAAEVASRSRAPLRWLHCTSWPSPTAVPPDRPPGTTGSVRSSPPWSGRSPTCSMNARPTASPTGPPRRPVRPRSSRRSSARPGTTCASTSPA
jgi:[protein-PII] uridylyltransferase